MTFADDIAAEFEDILAGEFSVRVDLTSKASGLVTETRGIFDETYEAIDLDEGESQVTAKFARITIYYRNLPASLKTYDYADIYHPEGDIIPDQYKIVEIQDESEGHAMLVLRHIQ